MVRVSFVPLTYDCNDYCVNCPVPRREGREDPHIDDVKEQIDRVLDHSPHIEFNGGEPTYRKDLLQILKYAHMKGAKELGLLTNCRVLSQEKVVKKLALFKNLKIITTLYSQNAKIHDAITRAPGSFEQKMQGMRNCVQHGIKMEVRVLIQKLTYKDFSKLSEMIIKEFPIGLVDKVAIMSPKLSFIAKTNKHLVSEKISIMSQHLADGVFNLERAGFNVRIYHFPHCVLPRELWKFAQGVCAERGAMFKPPKCDGCAKYNDCSGIWRTYYTHEKDHELSPIVDENTIKKMEAVRGENGTSITTS